MGLSFLRRLKNVDPRNKHGRRLHDDDDGNDTPFLLYPLAEDDLFDEPPPSCDRPVVDGAPVIVSPPTVPGDRRLSPTDGDPAAATEVPAWRCRPLELSMLSPEEAAASFDYAQELASLPRKNLSFAEAHTKNVKEEAALTTEGVKKGVPGHKKNRKKKEKKKQQQQNTCTRQKGPYSTAAITLSKKGGESLSGGSDSQSGPCSSRSPLRTFLLPSKKDTALISPMSQYCSHILLLEEEEEATAAMGVEMELSAETARGDGRAEEDGAPALPRAEQGSMAAGGLARVSPGSAADLSEAMAQPPPPPGPPLFRDCATSLSTPRRAVPDATFLTRLQKIGGMPAPGAARRTRVPPPMGTVPEYVAGDEGASMPSLLTEPELARRGQRQAQMAASAATTTPSYNGGDAAASRACAGLHSAPSEQFTALASDVSSATRAGGIERLLGLLYCGEDTSAAAPGLLGANKACGAGGLQDVLNCGRVLGAEADGVDQALEEEERKTLDFHWDISKHGIKLIYHKSPSKTSQNPDWIQSTVKLFLRSGNCHTNGPWSQQQPTLAWAVLPVVARSYDSSEDMWSHLGLLEAMMMTTANDDDDNAKDKEDEFGSIPSITGFFSITAANGAVYVFEAQSAQQRDYVVQGLRAVIARLTRHLVAGNATVMVEMLSKDVGQLTGELPSLISPARALGQVTNTFLDQL